MRSYASVPNLVIFHALIMQIVLIAMSPFSNRLSSNAADWKMQRLWSTKYHFPAEYVLLIVLGVLYNIPCLSLSCDGKNRQKHAAIWIAPVHLFAWSLANKLAITHRFMKQRMTSQQGKELKVLALLFAHNTLQYSNHTNVTAQEWQNLADFALHEPIMCVI